MMQSIFSKPAPQRPNIMNILTTKYPLRANKAKKKDNILVPKCIYQTWHTKDLPPHMKKCVDDLKLSNPDFTHHLYDDVECRKFIADNFSKKVLYAYDTLVPGAFKADLWRYCVLYKNGGIYLDIKYNCMNNFKLIDLTTSEHWVLDTRPHNIYNAFMVTYPNNPILMKCIGQIVINCLSNYYGYSCLDPTGPSLVGQKILDYKKPENIDMHHIANNDGKYIYYKNQPILKMYPEYQGEHETFKKRKHYSLLWSQKRIYRQFKRVKSSK